MSRCWTRADHHRDSPDAVSRWDNIGTFLGSAILALALRAVRLFPCCFLTGLRTKAARHIVDTFAPHTFLEFCCCFTVAAVFAFDALVLAIMLGSLLPFLLCFVMNHKAIVRTEKYADAVPTIWNRFHTNLAQIGFHLAPPFRLDCTLWRQ
jgi:hypothetical protein